ncbi:hypothetical protein NFI96_017337 [Prochilodus magdalenae]|nr:hypothetical protein NFI96_017337 [Prochilodus magdalenae]
MQTVALVNRLLCAHDGRMDLEDLCGQLSGLSLGSELEHVLKDTDMFVTTGDENKVVVAKTKLRLCRVRDCQGCSNLHLCKMYLFGECPYDKGRRGCRFCHDLYSGHNVSVLRQHNLLELDRTELCVILLQSDNTLLPHVCFTYNKGSGEYGNCADKDACRRLHICENYIRRTCTGSTECHRSHDFYEPHPMKNLQAKGVSSQLMGSMLAAYRNILTVWDANRTNSSNTPAKTSKKCEICLFHIKGFCKQGNRCWHVHFQLPYMWERKDGNGWKILEDNEEIERAFCDPAKTYSDGSEPVCFDTMTQGVVEVRRLSTASSVLNHNFILTTTWIWYWEDDSGNWIQFGSSQGTHRASSITSEDLEMKYQEDNGSTIEFTAGRHFYELSMQDMIQSNKEIGTKRLVRRRPLFLSADDVQTIKTSHKEHSGRPQTSKQLPRHWDKATMPETGFKRVFLKRTFDEYKNIVELFNQTMQGFCVKSIERVQNRDLWDVFQWQKDVLRKKTAGKENEQLLFHGTKSKHINAICQQNFDWRICGVHGTAYGKDRGGPVMQTAGLVNRLLCAHDGRMDLEDLCGQLSGLSLGMELEHVLKDTDMFVTTGDENKVVVAKTKLRLCRVRDCQGCSNLHLCKMYLFGECRYDKGRQGCRFCHDLGSEHNISVLSQHNLLELDRTELCVILLQNDNTLLPSLCFTYNKGYGEYGSCSDKEACRRLHVCANYIRGTCDGCNRSHDFYEPQPLENLQSKGVPSQLMGSMLPAYKNMLAIWDANRHGANASSTSMAEKSEICLFYIKHYCKHGNRCQRVHFHMPYKWEMSDGHSWKILPDNEEVERTFCNPAKAYSDGSVPVYFDTMTQGFAEVRRLSTASSVLNPNFILTTTWVWYWEDDNENWIQYGSSQGIYSTPSVTSEDLERKYQEDNSAVIDFTAGRHSYELNMQDMMQYNRQKGTKRSVRRRPVFLSAEDVQKIKASQKESRGVSQHPKTLPCHWDKTNMPESGFKRVLLNSTTDEYKKTVELFHQTMSGFPVKSIERVQNQDLWEVYQWQGDVMRKKTSNKENEKLLFHGTESKYVDAICQQNFDWRICGVHGTAYGKGSYFARDARYSHSYTDKSGTRWMFVCRVLGALPFFWQYMPPSILPFAN